MKIKLGICITLIALSLISCESWAKRIKGDGNIVSREIAITDYNQIDVSGSAKVYYEQVDGPAYLRIETDSNIVPKLDIEVTESGKLTIGSKQNINPTKLDIYTNSKTLSELKFAGANHVKLGKLAVPSLSLEMAGSNKVDCDSIVADKLDIEIAGSATINATGRVTTANFEISGSGKIHAFNLIADNVKCQTAGSGNVETSAVKTLDISIAGSGNIKYRGNPNISKSVAGSGNINREGDIVPQPADLVNSIAAQVAL